MLTEELRERTKNCCKHIALVQGPESLSYDAMWKLVDHYAGILRSIGVKPGDIIVLFAPNSIELAVIYLAIWQIGAIPCPFHGNDTGFLGCLLESHTTPKALVVQKTWSNIELLRILLPSYRRFSIFTESGLTVYANSASNDFDNNNLVSKTLVWMSSSGTTSASKIIKLGLRGTLANITANAESLGLCEDDTTLMCLSMSYSYGLIGQFLSHVYVGGKIVFPLYPNLIHTFPRLIRHEQITTVFTVPTLLRSLLTILSDSRNTKGKLSSLRLLTIGGSAIDKYGLQRALDLFEDTSIAITYGLAEAGPRVSTYFVRESPYHIGSVGQPIRGVEIGIVDKYGRHLPCGTEGEIVVFGPSVMQGYVFDSGDKNFIPEKMVYTGDRGYLSQDGYLYIFGPKPTFVSSGAIRQDSIFCKQPL